MSKERVVSGYLNTLSMLLVALAGIGGLYAAHRVWAIEAKPLRTLPSLSGSSPAEHALSRFHARW